MSKNLKSQQSNLEDKLEIKVKKLPNNCLLVQLLEGCWTAIKKLEIQRFQSRNSMSTIRRKLKGNWIWSL